MNRIVLASCLTLTVLLSGCSEEPKPITPAPVVEPVKPAAGAKAVNPDAPANPLQKMVD